MISKTEVQHIAKLARLELTEQEVEKMQKDLSSILDYFDLLKKAPKTPKGNNTKKQVSTSLIRANKGMEGIKERRNTTRKDEVAQKSASLANNLIEVAPDKKDGYIKVKAIFL